MKEDKAMSVEECARLIIDGMNGRKREVVMTAKGKVGRFMKLILPTAASSCRKNSTDAGDRLKPYFCANTTRTHTCTHMHK